MMCLARATSTWSSPKTALEQERDLAVDNNSANIARYNFIVCRCEFLLSCVLSALLARMVWILVTFPARPAISRSLPCTSKKLRY